MTASVISLNSFSQMKKNAKKFAVLTAYDAGFSREMDEAGIPLILVGDSLGMVVQGRNATTAVTLRDMCYHTKAVCRGVERALVMADLPFMSYPTPVDAISSAADLMRNGASIIKLEGGSWLIPTIEQMAERGIPVCGHLGLTPQTAISLGGFRMQGKTEPGAKLILEDAIRLQDAGASMLVVECVPASLGARLASELTIPVIGIGAGPDTDAQVLVMHDMLGLGDGPKPRFVKNFLENAGSVRAAFIAFRKDVESGIYPAPEHSYRPGIRT